MVLFFCKEIQLLKLPTTHTPWQHTTLQHTTLQHRPHWRTQAQTTVTIIINMPPIQPIPVHIGCLMHHALGSMLALMECLADAPITPQQQRTNNPPARPGAAAVPAPTGTPYTPNQYPPQPTRTTAAVYDDSPPPPQPGAVPIPPSQQHGAPVTAIPPPPKAGQTATLHEQGQAVTTQPPQMDVNLAAQGYAPTHSTSTTNNTPMKLGLGPTTLNYGLVSPGGGGIAAPSHPAGYQQNSMAQEMSSAARASLDATERRESLTGGFGIGSSATGSLPSVGSGGTKGMWDAVKGWTSTVGQTLAETEKKVWDSVNKS